MTLNCRVASFNRKYLAMTTPRQIIVNLVNREYLLSQERYRQASIDHAAMIASANTWDDFNENDGVGGMSQNPYRVDTAEQNLERARIYMNNIRSAYELAVSTFIV